MVLRSAGLLLGASASSGLNARRTATAHAFALGGRRRRAQSLTARPTRTAFGLSQSSPWPAFIHNQSLFDRYSSAAVLSGWDMGYLALLKKPPKRW